MVNSNITTAAIVRSDQIRINQILFNLLNNAIKFTHQGSIRVELQLIEGDPLAQLVIQVVDTGIGIREQDLTVILNPSCKLNRPPLRVRRKWFRLNDCAQFSGNAQWSTARQLRVWHWYTF